MKSTKKNIDKNKTHVAYQHPTGCFSDTKNRKERGGDVADVQEQIKNDYLSGVSPKKLSEDV